MCTHQFIFGSYNSRTRMCTEKEPIKLQKCHAFKTVIFQQHIWKPNLKTFTPVFEFSSTLHSSLRKHKGIYAASINCSLRAILFRNLLIQEPNYKN